MERVIVLNDTLTGSLFAIVTEKARALNFVSAGPEGNEWSRWAERQTSNRGRLEDVIALLDYGITVDGPKRMTRGVRAQLSEYAPKVEAEEAEEIVAGELVGKAVSSGDVLVAFSPEAWRSHLNFKALMASSEQTFSAVAYEVKRLRAMRIPSIGGSGGGWRCPPGTPNGGNFTDRFGANCGTGTTRRLMNRLDTGQSADRYTRRRVERAASQLSDKPPSGGRRARGTMSRLSYGTTSSRSSGRRYDTVAGATATRPRTGRPTVDAGTTPSGSRRKPKPSKESAPAGTRVSLKSVVPDLFRVAAPRDVANLEKARSAKDMEVEEIRSEAARHEKIVNALRAVIDLLSEDEKAEGNSLLQHHNAMASRWRDFAQAEAGRTGSRETPDVLERRSGREIADRQSKRDHMRFIEDAESDYTAKEFESLADDAQSSSKRASERAKNKNLSPAERVAEDLLVSHYVDLAERYRKLAKTANNPDSRSAAIRANLVKEILEMRLDSDARTSYLTRGHFTGIAENYRRESSARSELLDDEELSDLEREFNSLVAGFYDEVAGQAEKLSSDRRPDRERPTTVAIRETIDAFEVEGDKTLLEKVSSTFQKAKALFDKAQKRSSERRTKRVGDLLRTRYGSGQPPPWQKGLMSINDIWFIVANLDKGDQDEDNFDTVEDSRITAWAKQIWEHEELDTGKFKFRTEVDNVDIYANDGEIYISGSIKAYDPDRDEWVLVGMFMRRLSETDEETVYSEELKMGSGLLYIVRDAEGNPLRDVDGNYVRRGGANEPGDEGFDVEFGDKVRGGGFASLFNGHAFTLLRASGFKSANVHAVDDGAFVWGKIGYRSESVGMIKNLVDKMEEQLDAFRKSARSGSSAGSSIIDNEEQAKIIEYLIELAKASNYSYDAPQWPEFILALSDFDGANGGSGKNKKLAQWFQDFAPFDRGTLPFTDELVPLDPR
jgi:hypothetical protein